MATAIAVVVALAAGFCFALGSVRQQEVARQSSDEPLSIRLLWDLARQPRWLEGVALSVFSFGLQGLALAFGPLTLVQPLAATDVLFALPMIARKHQRRLARRDILGALTVTAGIVVFLSVSPPVSGVSTPSIITWLPVFLAVGILAAVSALAGLRMPGKARVVWLAAAAGALYALLDALTKATVDLLSVHGLGVAAHWEPYALAVTGVTGALFGQSAFSAGALSLSLPVIDTLEPAGAVVIGTTVFGEALASSPWQLALQVAGGVAAAAGIFMLSRSKIVEAETREEPAGRT